jgi:hypothetical protein
VRGRVDWWAPATASLRAETIDDATALLLGIFSPSPAITVCERFSHLGRMLLTD